MKASQKVGEETPISDTMRARWSIQLSRRTAATMPSGMPVTRASRKLMVASSSVAGANCAMSCNTGRWDEIEMPRSPWSSPLRKMK